MEDVYMGTSVNITCINIEKSGRWGSTGVSEKNVQNKNRKQYIENIYFLQHNHDKSDTCPSIYNWSCFQLKKNGIHARSIRDTFLMSHILMSRDFNHSRRNKTEPCFSHLLMRVHVCVCVCVYP